MKDQAFINYKLGSDPSKLTPLDVQVVVQILCEYLHHRATPAWRYMSSLVFSDVFEKHEFQSDKVWWEAEDLARLENHFVFCCSMVSIQIHGN